MERVETNPNLYHQFKRLVGLEEWKTFVNILEERKKTLYLMLETDEDEKLNAKKFLTQIKEINSIVRIPNEIVEDFEEKFKREVKK